MAEITAVIQHAALGAGNIHVPYDGIFANESARLSAQLDSSMEGKLFRQISDNTLWMLVSASSASWVALGKDTAKYLGKGGDDDDPMTFFWNAQNGQPSYVWGGNDGINMYVYNPSNFSVAYANEAKGLTFPTLELLTTSGSYLVKKTGLHWIILVGGGASGSYYSVTVDGGGNQPDYTYYTRDEGGSGGGLMAPQYLTEGQNINYTIGAGGAARNSIGGANAGGSTSFNGLSAPGGGGGKGTYPGNNLTLGRFSPILYSYGTGGAAEGYGGAGTQGAILIIR